MLTNQDNNKPEVKAEAKWYEIPLKDWAVIISALTFLISNAGSKAGSEEKLTDFTKNLTEINTSIKDLSQKYENKFNELGEKFNNQAIQIEVLKQRVESLEKK